MQCVVVSRSRHQLAIAWHTRTTGITRAAAARTAASVVSPFTTLFTFARVKRARPELMVTPYAHARQSTPRTAPPRPPPPPPPSLSASAISSASAAEAPSSRASNVCARYAEIAPRDMPRSRGCRTKISTLSRRSSRRRSPALRWRVIRTAVWSPRRAGSTGYARPRRPIRAAPPRARRLSRRRSCRACARARARPPTRTGEAMIEARRRRPPV